ncbi:MAG: hypothetical protein ACI837_000335 [Crocinitomicaceae bacterium]|jgi:hypothetical protein
MKITSLLILLFLSSAAISQTWSDDVAEIFYEKCAKCHHAGGVGPFPLMTHAETSPMASAIAVAVGGDVMPPWPPNNDYQEYSHDRSLSTTEKTTILDWITAGTPEGIPANTPPPPVFNVGSILGNGDLMVQIPTYMSKATTDDDYVCFALPSGLAQNRIIRAVEIVPGNTATVHHALIYIDPSGNSVTDTTAGDCGGPSSVDAKLVMGYTPGSTPLVLPSASPLKLGMTMEANSQVYFAMHYPEGSYGTYDSTKVIFHFYPVAEAGVREVLTEPVLQNWSMALAPNTVSPVTAQYPAAGGLPIDISLLSVFPHMHLLGQDFTVYAIQPSLDTLKLIDLPEWDFEWQGFYFFKNIQKAEAGATLYAEGSYDNTAANPHNPNDPPAWVYAGLNTSDEMFLTYAHYMYYLPGDETYNLDSLLNLSTVSLMEEDQEDGLFSAYPNPFSDGINLFSPKMNSGDVLSVYIYNTQGKVIKRLMHNAVLDASELLLEWDGTDEKNSLVPSGMYFISVNRNGELSNHRVVKN